LGGSESRPDETIVHHRVLVGADSEPDAVAIVQRAFARYGTSSDFRPTSVRDLKGEVRHTPILRWADIDWEEVQRKAPVSMLQRTILGALFNDHEPTRMIAKDPDVQDDRESVDAALRDLGARGLVDGRRGESGETGREPETAEWWAMTDECWELLGLIRSPRYR
jgi:hypothetical protein